MHSLHVTPEDQTSELRICMLDIERAGHRISIDTRNCLIRVVCNGAVHATFNPVSMGEIEALRAAVEFATHVEANALKYPKPSA